MPLTVACLFVQGEYPYTTEYVWRLYDMVLRWAGRDFRFVILTDQPDHVDFQEFHTVGIQKLPGLAYWSKLELFNPARDWTGRVLYLDLDTAIVGPLDPIIDVPHRFAITSDPPDPDRPRTHDRFGRLIVRRFNSSVMVWNAGAHPELYTGSPSSCPARPRCRAAGSRASRSAPRSRRPRPRSCSSSIRRIIWPSTIRGGHGCASTGGRAHAEPERVPPRTRRRVV
jgi:hypothetical protein